MTAITIMDTTIRKEKKRLVVDPIRRVLVLLLIELLPYSFRMTEDVPSNFDIWLL